MTMSATPWKANAWAIGKYSLSVVLVITVIAFGPTLLSILWGNVGLIYLVRPALDPSSAVTFQNMAVAYLERALRLDAGNSSVYRGLGRLYLQEDRYDKAAEALRQANASPRVRNQVSLWELGRAYAGLGRMDLAIAAWRQAGAAVFFLGEGKRYLNKGSNYCPQAENSLRLATLIDTQLAEAHYALGRTLHCLNRDEEAQESYQQAARFYEEDSPWRYLAQGHVSRYAGLWDEAVAAYQTAIAYAGQDIYAGTEGRFRLGEILYWKKGEIASATRYLKELIALRPTDVWPYIQIGDIYLDQKQFTEARGWYERAKQVDPLSDAPNRYIMMAYVDEGYTLRDAGKLDDAERSFRRAVDLFPQSAYAHNALGWFFYLRRHDASQAVEEFETAIALAPNDSLAYTRLGYVHLQEGRLAEAIEVLEAALRRNPQDAEAHANLGMVHLRQGALDAALKELEEAVTLAPRAGRYHEMLGDGYRMAGRRAEAIVAYRRALELEPGRVHSQHELDELLGLTEE